MVSAFAVSAVRACEVVQLQTSSYYYKAIPDPEELALRHRLRELAGVRVRFGYRRTPIPEMPGRRLWWVGSWPSFSRGGPLNMAA
jgi:hypothetical protein